MRCLEFIPDNFQFNSFDEVNAYCIFCSVGNEQKIANLINEQCSGIYALSIMMEKHHSKNGVKSIVRQTLLPGYVFIYSMREIPTERILRSSKVIRLLKDTDGECKLYGENLEYAKWVLKYKGMIGCSKAIQLGSRVQVVEGPLKDYEGMIKEVSKKNRNGRIEIAFMGRLLSIWLPFEWVQANEESDNPMPQIS